MTKISSIASYDGADSIEADLSEILVGRSIVGVDGDKLHLDDGTYLDVEPNSGCGGCSSGNYWIEEIAAFENAITRVSYVESERGDNDLYEVFVYAATGPSARILAVTGDVGNGWYGSGYTILVRA
jgi:hypothetical protein